MTRTAIANCVRLVGILSLALLCSLGPPSPAHAASFVVDSLGDEADADVGNGGCATAGGLCTLRAALQEANANGSTADTITFNTGVFPPATPATIPLGSTLPTLSASNTTVDASAAGVKVDGQTDSFNCFDINSADNILKGFELITNCVFGIRIFGGAQDNTIGGSTAGERNVISGNPDAGVGIHDDGTSGNVVLGNYIGTNAPGDEAIPNGIGVKIWEGSSGTILGPDNLISGNQHDGVLITGGSENDVVKGNLIGTDASGTADLGNGSFGIEISDGAHGAVIGGTTADDRNVISGNNYGVVVGFRGAASENRILGNYIGTDITGTKAMGDSGAGVIILRGSTGNTVGGPTTSERNVISGHEGTVSTGSIGDGVSLSEQGTTGNLVEGNYIGLDATGTAALANSVGVLVWDGASSNTIRGNTISGNTLAGLAVGRQEYVLSGSETDLLAPIGIDDDLEILLRGSTLVHESTSDGWLPFIVFAANPGESLEVRAASTIDNCGHIGPVWLHHHGAGEKIQITPGVDNGCSGKGVFFTWSQPLAIPVSPYGPASGNVIRGNMIGTNPAGLSPMPNGGNGIEILGSATGTVIGGHGVGEGNTVAFNGGNGVLADGLTTTRNTVSADSIYSNGGKGIENSNGGNTELAPPIIDTVGSASGHTDPICYPCTVEVFSDNQDEGRVYHGSTSTNNDATGTWIYPGTVTGPYITATITDATGNTSEFSSPVAYSPPVGGIAEFPSLEPDAALAGPGSLSPLYVALAGAAGVVVLAAGGWYARRRRRAG